MSVEKLVLIFLIASLPGLSFGQHRGAMVKKVAPDIYVHVSYRLINKVLFPSNGLIVKTSEGVILIDTGWDQLQTKQILAWINTSLKQKVALCIITHAHDDRMGGIALLHKKNIRTISTPLTAQKVKEMGYPPPLGILPADTVFAVGGQIVETFFPGKGHTNDNIVVWFPASKTLFGGCLIKSVVAVGMGNSADATTMNEWKNTVATVRQKFPMVKHVIPGHQDWSDGKALLHTTRLLDKAAK